MKFLVDNHLPIRLCIHLRNLGHECTHVCDASLDEAKDIEIWRYATSKDYVLISKDDDFVFLANRPGDTGRLVWVRLPNCRKDALLTAFDRVHDDVISAIQSGQRIIELR